MNFFEKLASLSRKDLSFIERILSIKVDIKIHNITLKKFKSYSRQTIIKIKNKISKKEVIFNPSRKNIKEEKICPFCKPKEFSIYEPKIGRIQGKYWISCENLFPYDLLHGMLIFRKHKFVFVKKEIFKELFQLSHQWFKKFYKLNKDFIFPFLGINYLEKAGASIEHPHFHLLLSKEPYKFEKEIIETTKKYERKFKKSYFSDFFKVCQKLGLSFKSKGIKITISPTPLKGQEIILETKSFKNNQFIEIFSKIFSLFLKEKFSFNAALIWKPFKKYNIPNLAFFFLRGKAKNFKGDMGVMELYGTPILNFDPWNFKTKLEKILKN